MRRRFRTIGAAVGLLWGLLVVQLSDGISESAAADLANRATAVCLFGGIGAGAGWVVGWVIDRLFREK